MIGNKRFTFDDGSILERKLDHNDATHMAWYCMGIKRECQASALLDLLDDIRSEAMEEAAKIADDYEDYATASVAPAIRERTAALRKIIEEQPTDPLAPISESGEIGERDTELKPCPFCGSETKWESPRQIWCPECAACVSFPICSVRSHARRLFNRRPIAAGKECKRVNGFWCETHDKPYSSCPGGPIAAGEKPVTAYWKADGTQEIVEWPSPKPVSEVKELVELLLHTPCNPDILDNAAAALQRLAADKERWADTATKAVNECMAANAALAAKDAEIARLTRVNELKVWPPEPPGRIY